MTTTCAPVAPPDCAVLASQNRLRRPGEFATTIRTGRRAGGGTLVVHLVTRPGTGPGTTGDGRATPPRAGIAVSRAVGSAVVRSRVKRRLRHQIRARLGSALEALAPGAVLVVRALPAASSASSQRLGADLQAALSRVGVRL